MTAPTAAAVADFREALERWPLWMTLGWHDILSRYRRTVLGPIWNTLSTAISIGGLGVVYGVLFKADLRQFLPYLAAGMISWIFVSTMVTDGCQTFLATAPVIKNVRLPLASYGLRVLVRNTLLFAHNLPVFVLVGLLFGIRPTAATALFVPGLALVLATSLWVTLALGILGARFRDLPPVVTSLVGVAFFVTPVVWDRGMLGEHQIIAAVNPFTHFVALLRDPLVGKAPPGEAWIAALAITAIGWCVTFWLFRRCRSRVVFWL